MGNTWTKITTVNPRTNQMIKCSFMNCTNLSLHPVFVASSIVHSFKFIGQHVSGKFLSCPHIGFQSAGWFTPQHLYCEETAITISIVQFSMDKYKPHVAEFPMISVALFALLQRKEFRWGRSQSIHRNLLIRRVQNQVEPQVIPISQLKTAKMNTTWAENKNSIKLK